VVSRRSALARLSLKDRAEAEMPATRTDRWKLLASALVLLTGGELATATPARAQTPLPADAAQQPAALAPPRVTRFVEAKRPEGTPPEGASVELELTIAADGTLTDAKVVTPAGDALDAAALEAVRQFTFEPARKGDKPVPARIRYRYTFDPEAPPVPPDGAGGAATPSPAGAGAPAAPAAPRPGRLEGRVLARSGDKAVAAATVTLLSDQGASVGTTLAAEDGAFAFADLPPGAYRLRIEADGFNAVDAAETVTSGEATAITYRLDAAKKKTDTEYEFGATASIAAPPREVTKRSLAPTELVRAAGTRGDPVRVIELLPGVARPPGLAGFIIVRGSSPFDSQAFFEGGPVDRIYHFGGLTSFVNGRLLDHIDLYPGNFSARYGRKMGGIIDVGIRDPKTDGLHGVADVNLIDASVLVEGPVGKRGGFAFAAKRSYIDFWFKNVIPEDALGVTASPVYYDYQAIYTHRPESGGKVRTMFFGSGDEFRLNLRQPADGDPTIRGSLGQGTSFRRLQTTWQKSLGAGIDQEIIAGVGTIEQDLAIGQALGFSFKGFDEFLRAEWRAQLGSRVKLIGGFDGYAIQLDVSYVGPIAQSNEGNPRYFSGPLTGLPTSTYKGPYSTYRPAGYLEALIQAGERLTLVPGIRVDYYSEIEKGTVNPRLTARLKVADQTTLKAGAGLYSQPPLYGETVAPVGNPSYGPNHAQHYGMGVEQRFGNTGSFSMEGFYKRLSDLGVNGTDANGNPLLVNGGKGRIYGLEVLGKLNPTGRAFGFVAYTLSRSERNDYGLAWRLFDFDQTHILTLAGGYRLGRWDLGGTFRLVSGNPRTPIIGSVYDANSDFYNPVYGRVNSARDPLFHQASVRVERAWVFQTWKLATYLDVQNFYNHRSQEGLQYSYDYSRSKPVQGLPILPSIGLRGEF
jgi:TonB family protein